MKKLTAVIAVALALPLAACSNAKYEQGAEYLTEKGYPMDAETFQTFADGTCESVKDSDKGAEESMEANAQSLQLVGMDKEEAEWVVATSVSIVCPEVID